jgi:hypothetical protein
MSGGEGSGTTAGPGMGSGIGCVVMGGRLPAGTGFPPARAGSIGATPPQEEP